MAAIGPLWRTILVPTDFSACSDDALAYASRLALHEDARVVLLHVVELAAGLEPTTRIYPEGLSEAVTVGAFASQGAQESLDAQLARVPRHGASVEKRIAFGRPIDTVCELADELGVDLVVIGTHGRTGLKHLFLGSVAERIVRTCKVPVLTLRHAGEGAHGTAAERSLEDEGAG